MEPISARDSWDSTNGGIIDKGSDGFDTPLNDVLENPLFGRWRGVIPNSCNSFWKVSILYDFIWFYMIWYDFMVVVPISSVFHFLLHHLWGRNLIPAFSVLPQDRTWKIGRETPDIRELGGLAPPWCSKDFPDVVYPCWYHLVHGFPPCNRGNLTLISVLFVIHLYPLAFRDEAQSLELMILMPTGRWWFLFVIYCHLANVYKKRWTINMLLMGKST